MVGCCFVYMCVCVCECVCVRDTLCVCGGGGGEVGACMPPCVRVYIAIVKNFPCI